MVGICQGTEQAVYEVQYYDGKAFMCTPQRSCGCMLTVIVIINE